MKKLLKLPDFCYNNKVSKYLLAERGNDVKKIMLIEILSALLVMTMAMSCNPQPKTMILFFESIGQKEWLGVNLYDSRNPGLIVDDYVTFLSIGKIIFEAIRKLVLCGRMRYN